MGGLLQSGLLHPGRVDKKRGSCVVAHGCDILCGRGLRRVHGGVDVWILIALLSRASAVPPEGWDLVGLSNNIEVARQSIQGSPLFAFRGETVTDIHISVLAGLLIKDSLGTEWVDLMSQSYMVERVGPDTKIVRQVYDLPWPVQDRDYVMRQDAAYDLDGKVFTLHFQSIDSGLEPVNDCCVRAEATRTYWRLQQLPEVGFLEPAEKLLDLVTNQPLGLLAVRLGGRRGARRRDTAILLSDRRPGHQTA